MDAWLASSRRRMPWQLSRRSDTCPLVRPARQLRRQTEAGRLPSRGARHRDQQRPLGLPQQHIRRQRQMNDLALITPELSGALTVADITATMAYAEAEKAPATREAYASDSLEDFSIWCLSR